MVLLLIVRLFLVAFALGVIATAACGAPGRPGAADAPNDVGAHRVSGHPSSAR